MDISEISIRQCSLTLGQFDSDSVNLLVTLFHHQNACSELIRLSTNLKEKFENLLTTKNDDDDEKCNDTPLTRIELAIMIHFKLKYLSDLSMDNDNNQLKSNIKYSTEDELNLAYCFLLAKIGDRVPESLLDKLKFYLEITESVTCLFDIYQKLGKEFSKFFSILIQCDYFVRNLVVAEQLIRKFQLFIKRYEDFLITFEKSYKLLPDHRNNYTQTDAILNENKTQEVSSLLSKFLTTNRNQMKPSKKNLLVLQYETIKSFFFVPVPMPVEQPSQVSPSLSIIQQPIPSSLNVIQKRLCVIINIKSFISSPSIHTTKRSGSDKDVDVIKVVFKKLNFTVLECKFDFKKTDLDRALNDIDDKNEFGDFDCLVMFIMSHGLLHSFFTADSKEIIIRDIVKRYSDSSPTTIWNGKPRMFFIQACRSIWPEHVPLNNREEIKQSDLSPQMLVAYSCSANEASKRSPTKGSIFIQILCIMLLRYGHTHQIQNVLEWTAKFITKSNECIIKLKGTQMNIQRPEYIEREFKPNFRFSNSSLYDKYQSWADDEKSILFTPLAIWKDFYDIVFAKNICRH